MLSIHSPRAVVFTVRRQALHTMLVPSSPLMLATHRVGMNAARSDPTQAEPHLMEGENSEGLPKHPLQRRDATSSCSALRAVFAGSPGWLGWCPSCRETCINPTASACTATLAPLPGTQHPPCARCSMTCSTRLPVLMQSALPLREFSQPDWFTHLQRQWCWTG